MELFIITAEKTTAFRQWMIGGNSTFYRNSLVLFPLNNHDAMILSVLDENQAKNDQYRGNRGNSRSWRSCKTTHFRWQRSMKQESTSFRT
jgi:hypothetical protein